MYRLTIARKWLWVFVCSATLFGMVADFGIGNKIDFWIHDIAVVFQARTEWKHAAIVLLDDNIPAEVARKQTLPLYARATEKLIAAGVKGVFMDARLAKSQEGQMPYAICIEADKSVRWSRPDCQVTGVNQCQVRDSAAGTAPLKMAGEVFPYFHIAPFLGDGDLPDFLLFDVDAEAFIPPGGVVASDRLITKGATIDRWMDLSDDHAAVTLARYIDPDGVKAVLKNEVRETCNGGFPCRRIRLSYPNYAVEWSLRRPMFPLSALASCNDAEAAEVAAKLAGRVVILQLTTPSEATDITITPMTNAMWGPNRISPGSQYLADAVETLLNNDHPREPAPGIKLLLFLTLALLGVVISAYLKQVWVWVCGIVVFALLCSLCILSKQLQLWPVTVAMLTYILGAMQSLTMHLINASKLGNITYGHMPKQVLEMLLALKEDEAFQHQHYRAVVLMSDLAGYTQVTSMLKEPLLILELMNDYLETTLVLQKNKGWWETYIGDMVCYYWPYKDGQQQEHYRNAIEGALELAQLQKKFFAELPTRYAHKFDAEVLTAISTIINAGIGVSSGPVVMGNLGPEKGVRKFGILGDPMNLTSRVEALTRHFNTEIIITHELAAVAQDLGYPVRRLGCFCVKGRDGQAETLFALGSKDDERLQPDVLRAWEAWLQEEENAQEHTVPCPELFKQDMQVLQKWTERKLLKNRVWNLEDK